MNAVKPIWTKTGPGKAMDQLMNKNAGKEAYKKHWCDHNDLGMHLKKGVPSKQKQKDCHSQKRDNQQECDDIKLFGRENQWLLFKSIAFHLFAGAFKQFLTR